MIIEGKSVYKKVFKCIGWLCLHKLVLKTLDLVAQSAIENISSQLQCCFSTFWLGYKCTSSTETKKTHYSHQVPTIIIMLRSKI